MRVYPKLRQISETSYIAAKVIFFKKSLHESTNPFTPGNFAENHVLKLVEPFSGHRQAIKNEKTVCRSCTSPPSDPDAKYSSGIPRKPAKVQD